MKGKKKLVIVLIALLAAGIYYYAALPAVNLHSSETWFAALILLVILVVIVVSRMTQSRTGRAISAIKSDELAAKAMGINTSRVKMIAFLLSCAMTALAGCLSAFNIGYVGPTDFGWKKSADWVIMVFFGGVNSLTGSIFGGAFLTFLPQYMQALNKYRAVVYAVLVLFILNFKPKGVFGEWELTPKNMRRALMRFNRKQRKVKER